MAQVLFLGSNPVNQAEYDLRGCEGSAVAIVLSELRGLARWLLQIDAIHEGRGQARVGEVLTVPAAGYALSYGAPVRQPAVRVVAIATCPGAFKWRVTARALPWSPPGYDPALAAQAYDPAAERDAAKAEVQITPTQAATSAPGVQIVDAGAPDDVPSTAAVDAQQIAVGAVPQLVLPEDSRRLRAYLRVNAGSPDIYVGPANVAVASGLRLAAADAPLLWLPRRPLWAVAAAAASLTLSLDLG